MILQVRLVFESLRERWGQNVRNGAEPWKDNSDIDKIFNIKATSRFHGNARQTRYWRFCDTQRARGEKMSHHALCKCIVMQTDRCKADRQTYLITHLAGERSLVAMNALVFFQIWSSNERLPTNVTSVRFEARVDLQVLWTHTVNKHNSVTLTPVIQQVVKCVRLFLPFRWACVVKALVQISQAKGLSAEWSFSCFLQKQHTHTHNRR